jgi:hypothetical protein
VRNAGSQGRQGSSESQASIENYIFCFALTFAHLFLCAAAILTRPDAEILRFLRAGFPCICIGPNALSAADIPSSSLMRRVRSSWS